MNLHEFLNVISESAYEDWSLVVEEGATFLNTAGVDADSHNYTATFVNNISIGMSWGLDVNNGEFLEEWVENFHDKSAKMKHLDFFYNGMLVYRMNYVVVDGFRCFVPVPKRKFDVEGNEEKLSISRFQYNVIRLLVELAFEQYEYDDYLRMAGIKIAD